MAPGVEGEASEPTSPVEEKVRLLFRQARFADAVPIISEHLARSPDDAFAYELMSDALRYAGDKPGAAAALVTASETWARAGQTLQSIAAQKRATKLGVPPDFSRIRRVGAQGGAARIPTPLFDDLDDDEFEGVAQRLVSTTHAAGDVVVREGDAGDAMFVIVRGEVDVVTGQGDGETRLATLGAGDFFGESSLLSGRPRTATIRAKGEVECLSLTRADFDELTALHPRMLEVGQELNRQRAASTIETLVKKRRGG